MGPLMKKKNKSGIGSRRCRRRGGGGAEKKGRLEKNASMTKKRVAEEGREGKEEKGKEFRDSFGKKNLSGSLG